MVKQKKGAKCYQNGGQVGGKPTKPSGQNTVPHVVTPPDDRNMVQKLYQRPPSPTTVYITPQEWEANQTAGRSAPQAQRAPAQAAPAQRPFIAPVGMQNSGLNPDGSYGEQPGAPKYANGGLVHPNNFINAIGYADGGQVGLQPAAPSNFMNAVGYESGGPIGQPGMQQMPAEPSGPRDPQMIDATISDGFAKNPQIKEEIKRAVQEAMATGELTPQELNQVIQLAKAAQHNPQIWPQLRSFVVNQGLAEQDELPPQYDQGLVSIILIIAKAVEQDLQQGGMGGPSVQPPQGMGQGPIPAHANGGMIRGPGTGTSDSIPGVNTSDGSPVKVSNGEYVIPASVVQAKGVDFFDGLVRKYHNPTGYQK